NSAAVRRWKAEDVAKLPLGRDHVRGLGHQVEAELFEPLLGFSHVGDRSTADSELGLFTFEDFSGELDRFLAAPELNVLLGKAPVLLFHRANLRHDLRLESPDGSVGIE